MPTTLHENRPSAGIGVVEVQKPMTLCGDRRGRGAKTHGFCDFQSSRATLCGDRRGRGANTHGFCDFQSSRATLCGGSACSRCKNPWYLRFPSCPRDPLRGSAWSRCKNQWFFAISAVPAQPSAGIGVVEVQKLEVFCDFFGARATLCGNRRGRGAKTRGFLRLLLFELVLGSCLVDATCILKQLAQSNLRRASCTEQLAQTNLHRPVCAERLA